MNQFDPLQPDSFSPTAKSSMEIGEKLSNNRMAANRGKAHHGAQYWRTSRSGKAGTARLLRDGGGLLVPVGGGLLLRVPVGGGLLLRVPVGGGLLLRVGAGSSFATRRRR
jgi:hypothetical protein